MSVAQTMKPVPRPGEPSAPARCVPLRRDPPDERTLARWKAAVKSLSIEARTGGPVVAPAARIKV